LPLLLPRVEGGLEILRQVLRVLWDLSDVDKDGLVRARAPGAPLLTPCLRARDGTHSWIETSSLWPCT
jgi:hypothetical protein